MSCGKEVTTWCSFDAWIITPVQYKILDRCTRPPAHLRVPATVQLRRRERQQPQEDSFVLLRRDRRRAEPRAQVHGDGRGAPGRAGARVEQPVCEPEHRAFIAVLCRPAPSETPQWRQPTSEDQVRAKHARVMRNLQHVRQQQGRRDRLRYGDISVVLVATIKQIARLWRSPSTAVLFANRAGIMTASVSEMARSTRSAALASCGQSLSALGRNVHVQPAA